MGANLGEPSSVPPLWCITWDIRWAEKFIAKGTSKSAATSNNRALLALTPISPRLIFLISQTVNQKNPSNTAAAMTKRLLSTITHLIQLVLYLNPIRRPRSPYMAPRRRFTLQALGKNPLNHQTAKDLTAMFRRITRSNPDRRVPISLSHA